MPSLFLTTSFIYMYFFTLPNKETSSVCTLGFRRTVILKWNYDANGPFFREWWEYQGTTPIWEGFAMKTSISIYSYLTIKWLPKRGPFLSLKRLRINMNIDWILHVTIRNATFLFKLYILLLIYETGSSLL